MKKYKIFFIIIFIISCNKTPENGNTEFNEAVGKTDLVQILLQSEIESATISIMDKNWNFHNSQIIHDTSKIYPIFKNYKNLPDGSLKFSHGGVIYKLEITLIDKTKIFIHFQDYDSSVAAGIFSSNVKFNNPYTCIEIDAKEWKAFKNWFKLTNTSV